ncbi:hypothetical protein DL765_009290 [Monosporascus sp. GIB2]|nr:hypothetical protein DL765_009290 [Monosporascus sp. GIB2]
MSNLTAVERRREQNRLAQRRFREKHGPRKAGQQRQAKSGLSSNLQDQDASPGDGILSESPNSSSMSRVESSSDFGDFGISPVTEDVHMDNDFDFAGFTRLSRQDQEWNHLIGTLTPDSHDSDSIERVFKTFAYGKAEVLPPLQVPGDKYSVCRPMAGGNDSRGFTVSPLHMAAKQGQSNIVRILLEHDADCNLRDRDGRTPLVHATIRGYEDVADLLLSHGASLRHVDNQDRSALHWAVLHRRDRLLRKLLKHCTDGGDLVNGYTKEGKTALHIAIEAGFESGVELLLRSGANVQYNARCDESSSAKHVEEVESQELD